MGYPVAISLVDSTTPDAHGAPAPRSRTEPAAPTSPRPDRRRRREREAAARRRTARLAGVATVLVLACALAGLLVGAAGGGASPGGGGFPYAAGSPHARGSRHGDASRHGGPSPRGVSPARESARRRRTHRRAAGRHGAPSSAGHRTRALGVGGEPADALPFVPDPSDRHVRPGEVPSLYSDGLPCSTGCRPARAQLGWPIRPFRRQHGLRAGFNELRPGSLHVGVDIQARDGTAVYAVQPGIADVLAAAGPSSRVRVGNYLYWHITPSVVTGETVVPFRTIVGHVQAGYGHLAFSELNAGGQYVNPLRPGAIVLSPYVNHAVPQIARPQVARDGQVDVAAYSPQTFVQRTTYPTPVLAPAALAWRVYARDGRPLTPLQWSFRGTHLLPFAERGLIYAPGAGGPGFRCFRTRPVCVPHWIYRAAGGLSPTLPLTLAPGAYRLTIYAWDWTDHVTALDTTVTLTHDGYRPIGRFPPHLVPGQSPGQCGPSAPPSPPVALAGQSGAPSGAGPADSAPITSGGCAKRP